MNAASMREFVKDLVSIKWYVAVSAALFFIGVAVGTMSGGLEEYFANQIEPLRGTIEQLEKMENKQVWMFLFIFFNNFLKSILVVFLGALLGLFPIYFLLMNGMILGFVAVTAGNAGLNVTSLIVTGILPHGILELSAVMIAAAYGLKYGMLVLSELIRSLRGRGPSSELRAFHGTIKRLIAFLFFALLTAAFIESTVTYFLVRG